MGTEAISDASWRTESFVERMSRFLQSRRSSKLFRFSRFPLFAVASCDLVTPDSSRSNELQTPFNVHGIDGNEGVIAIHLVVELDHLAYYVEVGEELDEVGFLEPLREVDDF